MPLKMTLKELIKASINRNDPIGDLCNDFESDTNRKYTIKYLKMITKGTDASDACNELLTIYRSQ